MDIRIYGSHYNSIVSAFIMKDGKILEIWHRHIHFMDLVPNWHKHNSLTPHHLESLFRVKKKYLIHNPIRKQMREEFLDHYVLAQG